MQRFCEEVYQEKLANKQHEIVPVSLPQNMQGTPQKKNVYSMVLTLTCGRGSIILWDSFY